jgi:hypothetical protein
MKRRILCATLIAAFATSSLLPSTLLTQGSPNTRPMRVLFIGNSYTYFNNLAMTIADFAMATRESRVMVPVVVLVGGSTLEAHLSRGDALREINKVKWDFVVLQDQSMRPLDAPAALWRDAQTLADAAKARGATVVMYETWAREAAPQLQDSLSRMYHRAAELAGGRVAHVGDAWAAFRATEHVVAPAHSALFFPDGSHPSKAGTYLAASVFYATFYGKSPEGLPPTVRSTIEQPAVGPAPSDTPRDSVSAAMASTLQRFAWSAAKP